MGGSEKRLKSRQRTWISDWPRDDVRQNRVRERGQERVTPGCKYLGGEGMWQAVKNGVTALDYLSSGWRCYFFKVYYCLLQHQMNGVYTISSTPVIGIYGWGGCVKYPHRVQDECIWRVGTFATSCHVTYQLAFLHGMRQSSGHAKPLVPPHESTVRLHSIPIFC